MAEKENLDPGKIPDMHPVEVYEKLTDSFEDIDSMKGYFEGLFNSYIHQNPDYYEWREYKDTDWPNFFLMVDRRSEKEKELDEKYWDNTFFKVMSALESIKHAEDTPPEKEKGLKDPKITAAVSYQSAMEKLTGEHPIYNSRDLDHFFKKNPKIPTGKGINELKEKTINSYLKAGDKIMDENKLKAAQTYHKAISMMDNNDQRQKEYGKTISEPYEELGDKREKYLNEAEGFNKIILGKPECYNEAVRVERGIYGNVREELKKKCIEANKKLGQIYLGKKQYELTPADADEAEFKARSAYEKALELDPKDTEAMKGIAEAYEKIGNEEKANEFYERLNELESGPDSYSKE